MEKHIKKILLIFLYLQPILDVIAGISINKLNINITLSSIIRLIFLALSIIYILKEHKKKNIIFLIGLFIYLILYTTTTLIYKDINALSYELKNTINTFYFPITLITLIDIFEKYKIKIELKHIVYIYMIYITLILIPNITNTGFQSYSHSKLGSVGWFTSANATGNILSILLPFITLYILKGKNKIIKTIIIPSTLYVFSSMGTKVPILSLLICITLTLLYYIIKWIKEKNKKNITISITSIIILTTLSIILIPKTTFYKNIQIHKNYLGIKNYTEILTNYELLDHFVFSQRLTFLKNTHKNYIKSSIPEKIIGIGYIENYGTDNISIKTIEIDYFEIFYRNGIIGVLLYLYIIIPVAKQIKIKEKTIQNTEYKISIILILLLALFSGHILITPAVSIFVSTIIVLIKGGLNEKFN